MTPDEAAMEALRKAHRELAARIADGVRPDPPPPVVVLIEDETGWLRCNSPARQLLADLAALGRSENILVHVPREGP